MYGNHLTLDLKNCNRKKLEDLDFVFNFLNDFPKEIGMHKITQPYVFKYIDSKIKKDWGITGFVIIAESHISIHTYPEKSYAFVDVFSCNEFNTSKTTNIIVKLFESKKFIKKNITRGENFPRG